MLPLLDCVMVEKLFNLSELLILYQKCFFCSYQLQNKQKGSFLNDSTSSLVLLLLFAFDKVNWGPKFLFSFPSVKFIGIILLRST